MSQLTKLVSLLLRSQLFLQPPFSPAVCLELVVVRLRSGSRARAGYRKIIYSPPGVVSPYRGWPGTLGCQGFGAASTALPSGWRARWIRVFGDPRLTSAAYLLTLARSQSPFKLRVSCRVSGLHSLLVLASKGPARDSRQKDASGGSQNRVPLFCSMQGGASRRLFLYECSREGVPLCSAGDALRRVSACLDSSQFRSTVAA